MRWESDHQDAESRCPRRKWGTVQECVRHNFHLCSQSCFTPHRSLRTHAPVHVRYETHRTRTHRDQLSPTAPKGRISDGIRREIRGWCATRCNKGDVRFLYAVGSHSLLEEAGRWHRKTSD